MASKLLHRILTFDFFDLWPWLFTCIVHWLQNATPSPFLTGFEFCLLYVIALGEGFKTSTQNFVPWPLWPLTLNLDLYGIFCLKNATPSPFLTWFWFHLLSVIALDKGLKTLLLLVLLFKWNIYLWLQQTNWCQSKDLHFRRGHILRTA